MEHQSSQSPLQPVLHVYTFPRHIIPNRNIQCDRALRENEGKEEETETVCAPDSKEESAMQRTMMMKDSVRACARVASRFFY